MQEYYQLYTGNNWGNKSMNQIVMYTTFRRFSWECPEKLFFYIYMIFIMQYYANWDAEVSRSRFKTVKNFWDQQNDFNSHNIGVQFYSEFFWTKVKLFSEFHFTAQFWVFKLKKRFRMAGGDKKFQPPFFYQKMAKPGEKAILEIFFYNDDTV